MTHWYPIIYSRTYQVDFHMLVMPVFFEDNDKKNWLTKHIRGTLISSGDFVYNRSVRWSLFSNDEFCIFGVSGLVSSLIRSDLEVNRKYFALKGGGTPYAFVGCAIKKENLTKLPDYNSLKESEVFEEIYLEYLEKDWNKLSQSTTIATNPFPIQDENSWTLDLPEQSANFSDNKIFTIKESKEDDKNSRSELWSKAARNILSSDSENVSLCFGFPSLQIARNTIFAGSTDEEYSYNQEPVTLSAENADPGQKRTYDDGEYSYNQEPVTLSAENADPGQKRTYDDGNRTTDKESSIPIISFISFEEIAGGFTASWFGFKIAGIPGAIFFFPTGILFTGFITEKGVGGVIRQTFIKEKKSDRTADRREQFSYRNNEEFDDYKGDDVQEEQHNLEHPGFKPKTKKGGNHTNTKGW